MLSFLSGNLDKQTALGNTALHYCSMYSKPECLKLLLRSKPTVDVGEYGQLSLKPPTVRGFTGDAGAKTPRFNAGGEISILGWELRSHVLCSAAKK